jgi:hypothetical protein
LASVFCPSSQIGLPKTSRKGFIRPFLLLVGAVLGSLFVVAVAYATSAPVMSVPGQASVTAAGTFFYSIPIVVPPGTAGMAPGLSLDYSSASTDGVEGWGWSLDGLAAITRCARTLTLDSIHGSVNYDMNDRFCLDGQRLMLVSGTYGADGSVYRTFIDSYSKIIAHGSAGNGPAWFEVHTKSGTVMEFGNTADSAIQAVGKTTNREWLVDKVTDTSGNYFSVTYTDDQTNGQAYPARIDYTGNSAAGLAPYNSVRFGYDLSRVDSIPTYQAGSPQKYTALLTDIRTYAGSTEVLDYKLGYRAGTSTLHSRVTSVRLCDASETNCLATTNFTWQGGTALTSMSGTANSLAQGMGLTAGDFNADGLTDAVVLNSSCTSGEEIYAGSNTGTFTPTSMTANYTYWMTGPPPSEVPYSGPACFEGTPLIGDLNGDGFADVMQNLQYWIDGTDPHWSSFVGPLLNTTTGALNQQGSVDTTLPRMIILGDFNGDGRMDGYGAAPSRGIYTSNGDGTFTESPSILTSNHLYGGDFDGDGCTDVLGQDTPDEIVYTCNPAVATASVPNLNSTNIITGDFNGDLSTDLLIVDTTGASNAMLYLSTGTGLDAGHAIPSSTGWHNYQIVEGDWNGDGKADIALISTVSGTPHVVFLSTGTGFSQATTIADTDGYDAATAADWNNDGATDLWIQSTSDTLYTSVFGSASFAPERIVSIDNGVGAVTTVAYDRLNRNGSFYTKGTGATYPYQDADGASYVVSSLSMPNGIGGSYTTNYAYGGMRINVQDPPKQNTLPTGFLAFSSITATDAQTGIVTTTNYRTDIPYVGAISSQSATSGSTVLRATTNTYAAASEAGAYALTLTQSVLTQNDLDGTGLPSVTTNYTYDSYGNPLTISQAISDGSSKTTTNTYSNDTTHWILGRLLTSSVTSTVTNSISGGGGAGNHPPVAVNDSESTNENTAVTFDPRSNDTDADGDGLIITGTGTPSHGTATYTGVSVTYTPTTGYSGSDSFSYTISDGHGHTASATIAVTMNNRPPTAVNDSKSTNENTALTFDPRTNDTDPDGDALTVSANGTASHGTVTHTTTSVTYTPTTGYSGSDSFTYTISDGHSHTASATVTMTVVNRPPTAVDDSKSTNENNALTFDPRTNDTDPDGDTLTITANGTAAHGTVSHTSTSVTYTPTHGYSGSDSFSYTISDGHGHTDSGTVTMTVVNRPPTAVNDGFAMTAPPNTVYFYPLANDTDPDGDTLTITSTTAGGSVAILSGGTGISFTNNRQVPGQLIFNYTISDGHGHTATAQITISYSYQCPGTQCS